jgi:uncharacterized membrane protein YphA (DoxX/SURF4 family)
VRVLASQQRVVIRDVVLDRKLSHVISAEDKNMSASAGSIQSAAVVGTPRSRGLHIGLWVAQVVLALVFAMAGLSKLTQPIAELAKSIPSVATLPQALVRFIGVSEFAGALGLILPSVTRIKPMLTAWAAVGLIAVMVLAFVFDAWHGEAQALPVNVVLGGLAAFVAKGRFGKARIPSRG